MLSKTRNAVLEGFSIQMSLKDFGNRRTSQMRSVCRSWDCLSQRKKRLRRAFIVLHNQLKGGCRQKGDGLLSLGASNTTTENGLKCHQGRCRWDLWKKFFSSKVIRLEKKLPRQMAESPSLEAFKRSVAMAFGAMVYWWSQHC